MDVALDARFRFDAQSLAYVLDLETVRLEPGAYTVSFVVLGDLVVHTVAVRVR